MCLTSLILDLTAHVLSGNTVYFLCRFRAIAGRCSLIVASFRMKRVYSRWSDKHELAGWLFVNTDIGLSLDWPPFDHRWTVSTAHLVLFPKLQSRSIAFRHFLLWCLRFFQHRPNNSPRIISFVRQILWLSCGSLSAVSLTIFVLIPFLRLEARAGVETIIKRFHGHMVVDRTTPNLCWVRCFSEFCYGFLTLNLSGRKARFKERKFLWTVSQFWAEQDMRPTNSGLVIHAHRVAGSSIIPPSSRIGGSTTPGFS